MILLLCYACETCIDPKLMSDMAME